MIVHQAYRFALDPTAAPQRALVLGGAVGCLRSVWRRHDRDRAHSAR
jgi:hypothetical protein